MSGSTVCTHSIVRPSGGSECPWIGPAFCIPSSVYVAGVPCESCKKSFEVVLTAAARSSCTQSDWVIGQAIQPLQVRLDPEEEPGHCGGRDVTPQMAIFSATRCSGLGDGLNPPSARGDWQKFKTIGPKLSKARLREIAVAPPSLPIN